MTLETCDVAIIGAGPSGAVAAGKLVGHGWDVRVVERQRFPRFSIGESLLPQSMRYLEEAGLLDRVIARGFQHKDGAAFAWNGRYTDIYFPEKWTEGWGTTFQVRRDEFDQILIEGAAAAGARVSFGDTVTSFAGDAAGASLAVRGEDGGERRIEARFVLDASGFGRVLPRLLVLDRPSDFPVRRALFRHVRDRIADDRFDRNKILISIHPDMPEIWYWLIPLADGLSSIGVVGPDAELLAAGADDETRLDSLVGQSGLMAELLVRAETVRPAGTLAGYACTVTRMHGPGFALLGNAGEFLDPVFSSGVTIAVKSAAMAADLLDRQLRGGAVDWEREFAVELKVGVDTFRACVEGWYEGGLQRIIFGRPARQNTVARQLTSVLAGYAWDRTNPMVRQPRRYLRSVEQLCAQA
jgi:hypothetical protein